MEYLELLNHGVEIQFLPDDNTILVTAVTLQPNNWERYDLQLYYMGGSVGFSTCLPTILDTDLIQGDKK